MAVTGEVVAAVLDEFRWRRDKRRTTIGMTAFWLATYGLALTFLGAAIGTALLRLLSRRASST